MAYVLIVVESPTKCAKIESILGEGYRCVASFGHVREIKGLEAIDVDGGFVPTFTPIPGKRKQIAKIRELARRASDVILASDDDREGEAISWHVCEILGMPVRTTKRMVFNEITAGALHRGLASLRVIDMDVVRAQQSRQVLDMLVGFKISPVLWKEIPRQRSKSLSAGRCQTPALRIVYDNEVECNANPGRQVYRTTGYFTRLTLPFVLDHKHETASEAEAFLEATAQHSHVYSRDDPRRVVKDPPRPYTTSSLQQAASNELRFSPKKTMELCQRLYERGLITYMRTDSSSYSKEFLGAAGEHIRESFSENHVRDDLASLAARGGNEAAQEAHEAIRPTDISVARAAEGAEGRLYALIRRNALESCMAPCVCEALTARLSAHGGGAYSYTVERVTFPGWRAVAGVSDPDPPAFGLLLSLTPGSVLDYSRVEAKVTLVGGTGRLTEARLVRLLEAKGIGRPSTFSSLVDKIQERGYVKKRDIPGTEVQCVDFVLEGDELSSMMETRTFGNERAKLQLQPLGRDVVEFLTSTCGELFEYDYTRDLEEKLDAVSRGDLAWTSPCQDCMAAIAAVAGTESRSSDHVTIDSEHVYMVAKYGPVVRRSTGGKTSFIKARDGLDPERLRRGDYALADIVAKAPEPRELGMHEGSPVVLLDGRYGVYAQWKDRKVSLSDATSLSEPTLEQVVERLERSSSSQIVREIDARTCIRTGKYGDYVLHRPRRAGKPVFIKLAPFTASRGPDSYKTCSTDELVAWLSTDERYSRS